MSKFNNLKQFLGQFIKNSPNSKEDEMEQKYREERKRHRKEFEEREHGKHDHEEGYWEYHK